jgi:carbamoyl-phosphate synthase large subunit
VKHSTHPSIQTVPNSVQSLSGKRVFVSGGAGVIGSELIPMLHAVGADVMVGDLKPRPTTWPSEIRYRQGDLNELTYQELRVFSPEVFVHLAATFERSTETYGFWEENFRHNVRLSHHLMSIHKDLASLRRVLFASSYLIYDPKLYSFSEPQTKARRLREDDPILPRNLTGMAKLAHEIELRFLEGFRKKQFSAVIARIYRGYGRGSHCVVSRWIRALLRGESIQVYRPEGLFDYIYAGETARGLIKLVQHSEITGMINLGTDRARRVSEVVDILRQHFPDMKSETCESDISFEASQANMDAFQAATGWKPERHLEDAIPLIIEHERQSMNDGSARVPGHVLVTSAAKKIPLLRRVKLAAAKLHPDICVLTADSSASALAQYFSDGFWTMPYLRDMDSASLIAACRERDVTKLIPTRDGELAFFAQHREALRRAGISIMVSAPEAVDVCLDKLRFSSFGLEAGLPVIPSREGLPANAGGAWVVKERYGAGSLSIGINLQAHEAFMYAKKLANPIFQPFVGGMQEFSADIYVDRGGQMKGCVIRTRDVVVNGESQVTTTTENEALRKVCQRLVSTLPFYGHIIVQAFVDASGGVHLIEVNPRFGGASSLAIEAGLDSFYWFFLESQGADLSDTPCLHDPVRRLRQVRHAHDLIEVL